MHLLIIPSYYPNTYSSADGIYFKVQAEALHKSGLQVGLIAPIIIKHYVLKREKKLDYGFKDHTTLLTTFIYQIPSFPVLKWVNDLMRLYFGKKLFKKYISENGIPDLVHLHSFENGIVARWIKKKYQIPFVLTEHSTRFSRNEYTVRTLNLAKKTFEECSESIVVSPHLKHIIESKFGFTPQVVPNLIDTNFFKPEKKEKRFDFITIGGLREPKNYELLIRSLSEISQSKNVNLGIIGTGPLKNNLEKLIHKLNLTKQVFLLGSKSPLEIVSLLNESKIFISSSSIETFGVAIIEAMSCGLPVVATKSGGPEYFLTSKRLGILCENDQKNLVIAMQSVLEKVKEYDSAFIRKYIIDHFSEDVISKQLHGHYLKILKNS